MWASEGSLPQGVPAARPPAASIDSNEFEPTVSRALSMVEGAAQQVGPNRAPSVTNELTTGDIMDKVEAARTARSSAAETPQAAGIATPQGGFDIREVGAMGAQQTNYPAPALPPPMVPTGPSASMQAAAQRSGGFSVAWILVPVGLVLVLGLAAGAGIGAKRWLAAKRDALSVKNADLGKTLEPSKPADSAQGTKSAERAPSAAPTSAGSASSATKPAASAAPNGSSAPTTPAAPASSSEAKTGIVNIPAGAHHRVFVDGANKGHAKQLTLSCGTHSVKVGSGGKARAVDVPCGGEITL